MTTTREIISTDRAPAAIGTYSQAVRVGDVVYLSGQIPLDPSTMELVSSEFEPQVRQVFANLEAVTDAAGASLNDAVKLTVYLTDLANFATVNTVMAEFLAEPYPARVAVGVSELPRDASVEIDAVVVAP